jgi:hypothetical protein
METLKSMCCFCDKDVEFGVYKSLGVMQQVPMIGITNNRHEMMIVMNIRKSNLIAKEQCEQMQYITTKRKYDKLFTLHVFIAKRNTIATR